MCKTLAQEDLLYLTFLNYLRKAYKSISSYSDSQPEANRFSTRCREIMEAMCGMGYNIEEYYQRKMNEFVSANSLIKEQDFIFDLKFEKEGNKVYLNRELFDSIDNRFTLEKHMVEYHKTNSFIGNYLIAPLDFLMTCEDYRINDVLFNQKHKKVADNMFAYCTQDNIFRILPFLNDIGVTKLYWTNVEKGFTKYKNVELIPTPYHIPDEFDEVERDLKYSFIGYTGSHPKTREPINDLKSKYNILVDTTDSFFENSKILNIIYHYNIIEKNKIQSEYQNQEYLKTLSIQKEKYNNILSRSEFSICPRGSNAGSCRFWESIKAGSIPILIGDDWKLPEYDWENTIIQISEKDWVNGISNDAYFVDKIVDNVDVDRFRKNCLNFYTDYNFPSSFDNLDLESLIG